MAKKRKIEIDDETWYYYVGNPDIVVIAPDRSRHLVSVDQICAKSSGGYYRVKPYNVKDFITSAVKQKNGWTVVEYGSEKHYRRD